MKQKRDFLDYVQLASTSVATLAIPIVLLLVGNGFIASQNERGNAVKYIEIAIGILRSDPKEQDNGLRVWAIQILDLHSKEFAVLPLKTKENLLSTTLNINGNDWGNGVWTDSCSTNNSNIKNFRK